MNCLICYQYIINKVTLPCNHNFCYSCIKKWIEIKQICPYCVRKLSHKVILQKMMEHSPEIVTRSKTLALRIKIYTEIITKIVDDLAVVTNNNNYVFTLEDVEKVEKILKLTYKFRNALLCSGNVQAFITIYYKLKEAITFNSDIYYYYYFIYKQYIEKMHISV